MEEIAIKGAFEFGSNKNRKCNQAVLRFDISHICIATEKQNEKDIIHILNLQIYTDKTKHYEHQLNNVLILYVPEKTTST